MPHPLLLGALLEAESHDWRGGEILSQASPPPHSRTALPSHAEALSLWSMIRGWDNRSSGFGGWRRRRFGVPFNW